MPGRCRQNVTVTADRLIAFYRPKNGQAPQPAQTASPMGADTGGNEIYRVQAEGNVRIFTPTDQAQGDRAVYDLDQAVLVMTGHDLKLTTPNDVLTARDSLEYWSQKHMAVARGNAVVVTNDGRRLAADTLVAYTTDAPQPRRPTPVAAAADMRDDPLAASGKLQKVEAFGNVTVRTVTDTAIGDRAVYVPDTGIARLAGHVRITRGENQLDGTEAEVNMKTGIARLLRRNRRTGAGSGDPERRHQPAIGRRSRRAGHVEMNDMRVEPRRDRSSASLRAARGWRRAASARPTRSARWCGT